jgi:hypothetical protein
MNGQVSRSRPSNSKQTFYFTICCLRSKRSGFTPIKYQSERILLPLNASLRLFRKFFELFCRERVKSLYGEEVFRIHLHANVWSCQKVLSASLILPHEKAFDTKPRAWSNTRKMAKHSREVQDSCSSSSFIITAIGFTRLFKESLNSFHVQGWHSSSVTTRWRQARYTNQKRRVEFF